jgi:phage shock protein A
MVATAGDYALLPGILDEIMQAHGLKGANVAKLNEVGYAVARSRLPGLPSRLVTLGIRDHFANIKVGHTLEGIPLDEKLFSIKSASEMSLVINRGRRTIAYHVEGYVSDWDDFAPARLYVSPAGAEIRIGVPIAPKEQLPMIHDGILSRMGRVIAGAAHAIVDDLEAKSGPAVVEEAIREIDKAAGEARDALGKDRAEEQRLSTRLRQIATEIDALGSKVESALAENREDLAKAAIARQVDLEAQVEALKKAVEAVQERVEEGQKALQAVAAARADAVARLEALRTSTADNPGSAARATTRPSIDDQIARSLQAVTRVTGVSSGPTTGAAELDELDRIHRDRQIAERLAQFKSRSAS